jgi:nicotinamide mononucleotide transporter
MNLALEIVAAVSGLLCVYLTMRQNIWCWPVGLVQIVLYVYLFWVVKLYSDVILQVVFLVLQFYGWYNWLHGGEDHGELKVSRLPPALLLLWIGAGAAATAAVGTAMAVYTDAALPYWDASGMVYSLIAQWLMTRKKLESWLFWIAVDVLSVGIYLAKSLYPTAGLYAVFFCMATMGLIEWARSYRNLAAVQPD